MALAEMQEEFLAVPLDGADKFIVDKDAFRVYEAYAA
jgi:hypothetical protein